MASTKTLIPCLAALLLMINFTEAIDFVVGGNNGSWQVPSSPDDLNNWAQKARFQIGDSIVFKYDGKKDSVLQVTEQAFKTCNISNPIKSYDDGNTNIEFDRSGPFFFISGADGHCDKGQKLEIKVLSPNHNNHSPAPAPAPSPAEEHHHAPAPAPHNGGSALKMEFLMIAMSGILALV